MSKEQLAEKHSFFQDLVFKLKVSALTCSRIIKNLSSPTQKFSEKDQLKNEPIISFSESELWNLDDNKENWILTAGKIENLRIAAKKLNGIEIKANEIFSFWQHIGNPNYGKGYVVGREIREGCIVPTIAGGLCQLSNALYDAVLKANFDIVERHKHSQIIKGSLAEQDRDATVKWNYIDLRFKSKFDFRLEVELSADKLRVTFRSKQKNEKQVINNINTQLFSKLNDCYSCGNHACFKHPNKNLEKQKTEIATTTFIVDEKWPEFDAYLKINTTDLDKFIVPLKKSWLVKTNRYSWSAMKAAKAKSTFFEGIYRAIKLRYAPKSKNNVFELSLGLDKKIAKAAAKKISVQTTHLLISQNLLPFIYETGALGGRTYDVLMTRLPIEKLHERLDLAYLNNPESQTLKDYRASTELVELENKALTQARKIITPHAEIEEIFKNKAVKLDWHLPAENKIQVNGNKILFPASAVGRKGAYEIKKLAKELNITLLTTGRVIEVENFWEGIKTECFDGDFNQIGIVLYPAYVESQPRLVLRAIAKGIPVITTTVCGIYNSDLVKVVETGNYEQLKSEVRKLLSSNKNI